jgi:hypothetical protein
MEVPLIEPYPLVGTLLRTSTPGAETFGLIPPPSADGPRPENEAMLLLMSSGRGGGRSSFVSLGG